MTRCVATPGRLLKTEAKRENIRSNLTPITYLSLQMRFCRFKCAKNQLMEEAMTENGSFARRDLLRISATFAWCNVTREACACAV
jgi:hypothetical protein